MQVNRLEITSSEIEYSERVLLKNGEHFDEERQTFIKNLNTLDLRAVPGSGKTTALMAKLLAFEHFLPFNSGSGILVISHTNAAVDEIKNKIGRHCQKLFSYPNFIGTIQSFVDEFLAVPYYVNRFSKKPTRIDNEIYDEQVEWFYKRMPNGALKAWLRNQSEPIKLLKELRLNTNGNLVPSFGKTEDNFRLKNKNSASYTALKNFKLTLLKQGILHFDDAYLLANVYIQKYPKAKNLLQKRFQFVFVDEMQDMDKHQLEILEEIFYDGGNSISNFQRIGDKNQAIFNSEVKLEHIWTERPVVLELTGSHRLNPNIAKVVKYFGVNHIDIVGKKTNTNGTPIDIKPHLIIFNDDTKEQVIPRFSSMIKSFQVAEKIELNPKNKFKAIAWNTKRENGKLRLVDYFPAFSKEEHKPKIDFSCLESYLIVYDKESKTLKSIRNNILNAFLRIMRQEDIIDDTTGRNYSKHSLHAFLSKQEGGRVGFYEKMKLKIFQWSIAIIKGLKDIVVREIREYLSEFLSLFDKGIRNSSSFIHSYHPQESPTALPSSHTFKPNTYSQDNIEIEVTTIHSVKGQTHTATLYLETNYEQQRNGVAHESQRLKDQFKGVPFSNERVYHKQSARMAYVGFSRPTHLLCYAVHQNRFESCLSDIDSSIWEIIRLENSGTTVSDF